MTEVNNNFRKGICVEKSIYVIRDEFQFILIKYSGKFDKIGNETYKTLAYCSSIQGLAEKVYMLKIKESTAATMQELVDDHKQIIKDIRETFKIKGVVE